MTEERKILKRRNPKNQGGRPRIEDIEELTPEMEEVAQLIRAGFNMDEVTQKMRFTTEKTQRILKNKWVKQRVRHLYGNRLDLVASTRDRLWDCAAESQMRMMKEDNLESKYVDDILKRYDPYERSEKLTKDEKQLVDSKRGLSNVQIVGSSSSQQEDTPQGSIFKKRIIGKEDHEKKLAIPAEDDNKNDPEDVGPSE